jgi:phage tail tube protein FII|nr:MAG TPA: tail tube protein [Caudoviricetes sp.]
MAGVLGIPGVINNFNLYYKGNALVGLTGEITLPDFEGMTETLSGPGILGELEEVIIGAFGSMELEVPFRILDEDAFKIMSPMETLDLTLRASEQYTVKSTGNLDYKGMRVVVRGRQKKMTAGTIKQGGAMDSSVTVEVAYIMIELDGQKRIELDKLNNVYKVNDKDLLAKVRSQC